MAMYFVKREHYEAVRVALERRAGDLSEAAIAEYTNLPITEVRAALYAIAHSRALDERPSDDTMAPDRVLDEFLQQYATLVYPYI